MTAQPNWVRTLLIDELDEQVPDVDAALGFITRICFKLGPPSRTGLELEWLLADASQPFSPLTAEHLALALGRHVPADLRPYRQANPAGPAEPPQTLRSGSAISVEPGGQVEVSTQPFADLGELVHAARSDVDDLGLLLGAAGLGRFATGADPYRWPARIRRTPRYAAMESFYDRSGSAGRTMMCSTAAVQVCVDAGTRTGADSVSARWRALVQLAPALIGMFANSPRLAGRVTGWKSTREANWLRLAAPPCDLDADPLTAYPMHALQSSLVCQRRTGHDWSAPADARMLDWILGRLETRPTFGDLRYHLSTLFPPVRPQGHLEVRYLDTQPGDDWIVVAAVVWALLASPARRDAAVASAEPVLDRWTEAARVGLDDPDLARAAGAVIQHALDELVERQVPREIVDRVRSFAERNTWRGRCPADDDLDGFGTEFIA